MRKALIFKPANAIYSKNRLNKSKSDLQSHEIIAFAHILSKYSSYDNIALSTTIHALDVCGEYVADNITLIDNIPDSIVDIDDYVNECILQYTANDTLFIMNGITKLARLASTQQSVLQHVNIAYMHKLIAQFPGRVAYILTDTRLMLHDISIELYAKIDLITQAKNIVQLKQLLPESLKFKSVTYAPLQYIPLQSYTYRRMRTNNAQYDIAYTALKMDDLGKYRRQLLLECFTALRKQGISTMLIADKLPHDFRATVSHFVKTVKYDQLQDTVFAAKSQLVIAEYDYEMTQLLPNRIYESLMNYQMPWIMCTNVKYAAHIQKHTAAPIFFDRHINDLAQSFITYKQQRITQFNMNVSVICASLDDTTMLLQQLGNAL